MRKTIFNTSRALLCLLAMQLLVAGALRAQQDKKGIPLNQALQTIEKKFHAHFGYEHNLLNGKFTTQKALNGESLSEVLKNVLYPNNLLFLYVSENTYSIVARNAQFFQENGNVQLPSLANNNPVITETPPRDKTLHGVVIDEKGASLSFVSIWVKGTHRGAQTGDRGEFLLQNLGPTDSLVFTFVGYKNETIAVNNQTNITVQLLANNKAVLDEVTVVSNGLQQLPKERATGSFATISGKELEKNHTPNVIDRLEGQLPGVKINVMAGDRSFIYGGSGNQTSINGGTRTVGTNDYNMSVRGKGTLIGESFPLIVVDGAITDLDISTLNPDDIENVTFLKDAAAASIWGIRAANGVMVVTTKKGRINQTPSINFSVNASIAERPNLGYLKRMNSAQQIGYETELANRGFMTSSNIDGSSYNTAIYYPNTAAVLALKLKAGTISQSAYNASIDSLKAIDNTSQILNYLLKPATNQEYNLSISGGNYNSNYYYSASYSREAPNATRTIGQRLTVTMNNSWKLFKVATLSTSFKGSFFNYANNGNAVNSLFPSTGSAVLLPYMQLVNNTGASVSYDRLNPDFTKTLSSVYSSWKYNYLDELNNRNDVQKDNNYVASANLSVPIYKGLSASGLFTNEQTFSDRRVFYNPQTYYYRNLVNSYTPTTATTNGLGITSGGILSMIETRVNNYALRGQLAYDRTINRIHQINAIAGSEIRQTLVGQSTSTLYGYNTNTGLSTPVSYLSSAYTSIAGYSSSIGGSPTQADKQRRYLSYFSNAAYTFKEKYSLSGSVRYDDYNNFGLDRKYRATPLWSSGVKWNITKEEFMKNLTWINSLGLRATYGVNGNISTSTYPFTAISLASNDLTTGLPYAFVNALANPELKWEKTYVTNIGLDYSLFNNRLSGTLDVYKKDGKDLLYAFPINAAYAGTIGSYYLTRNSASMTGKGIDFGANVVAINNKNFTWNIGFTASYNTNKLVDNRFDTSTISSSYTSYYPGLIGNLVGYATDKLLVFRNAGLNAAGLTRVYNRNGDTVSATSPLIFSDLKNAGHTTAPWFGSWTTNFRYKHLSLYALFTYQFGGVFLKPSINSYITSYYTLNYSISSDIDKRWKQAGDEKTTNVPGLNGTATQVTYSLNRYQYSDINVLSSDYIRLRELSLNYEFPAAFISRLQVKGANLGISVRNLGLIWKANKGGYDPDFVGYANGSYSLPAARSYNLSFKLNF